MSKNELGFMDRTLENNSSSTIEEMSRLAAKALGYQVRRKLPSGALLLDGDRGAWDPENSNGDTMELIVGLKMMVHVEHSHVSVSTDRGGVTECIHPLGGDHQKAVRHAVLRVAAEHQKGVSSAGSTGRVLAAAC